MEAEPADAASAVDAVPREALVQRAISETEDLVPSPPIEGAIEPGMHGSPAPKAERQAVLVGYGVKLGTTTRRARKPGPGPAQATASLQATAAPAAPAWLGSAHEHNLGQTVQEHEQGMLGSSEPEGYRVL